MVVLIVTVHLSWALSNTRCKGAKSCTEHNSSEAADILLSSALAVLVSKTFHFSVHGHIGQKIRSDQLHCRHTVVFKAAKSYWTLDK